MRITVAGARLFVDVLGPQYVARGSRMVERPTVIIPHGGPGLDSAGARILGELIADAAHVIVYDHLGNGRSDRGTPAEWTLDRWADDLRGLCDAVGVHRPVVIGGSFAGFVTMRYAARHPDHPAGIVLQSTSATNPDAASIAAFRRRAGDEVAEIVRRDYEEATAETSELFMRHALPYMSRHPRAHEITETLMARTVRRQDVELHFNAGEFVGLDQRPDLARIRCRTLVVSGADDPVAPPELAREIAHELGDRLFGLHVVANAGHLLAIDAPEPLAALLRDFIAATANR